MIKDIYAVGKLRSELITKKRGSELTPRSFDGHMLDEVSVSCTLLSKEDCQQLIDFLNITKECYQVPEANIGIRKKSRQL